MSERASQAGEDDLLLPGGRVVPSSLLRWTAVRSSGPGGQHANKTATKVQFRIELSALEPIIGHAAVQRLRTLAGSQVNDAGELVLRCGQTRSQQMNRAACRARLRAMLVAAMRPPRVRRRTAPTRASKRRRREDKAHTARQKRERRPPRDDF